MTEPPAEPNPVSDIAPTADQPSDEVVSADIAVQIAAAQRALLANGADVATRLLAELGIPDQN